MKIFKFSALVCMFAVIVFMPSRICLADKKINIVASTPDLASIASNIGGDKIIVLSITKGNGDPHSVEVLPYYMMQAAKADIFLKVGLSLDQWADSIIKGSGNKELKTVDCSKNIRVFEKDLFADMSKGHAHPDGNPHYWLNPLNSIIIAENIKKALIETDKANKDYYENNFIAFKSKIEISYGQWKEKMSSLKGKTFISYHSSWVYFADAFDMEIAANVEPFPGIPPTAKHLSELIKIIKEKDVKFLLQETYFSKSAGKFLNKNTQIKVIIKSPSGAQTEAEGYFNYF
ncbi:MAG: metal ABC transporter substrate-binding protein, partial [Endomicrobium sp.]|nr:metal ABC transporter substrate-binding protein [Endomicrobium sp.]